MKQIPRLDLHLHSPYSDGSTSIQEIISAARIPKGQQDLKLIALTDHNTLNGIGEFKKTLIEFNKTTKDPLLAVAGIEISASYRPEDLDQEIHVLGYFPLDADFEDKKFDSLQKLIANYKNSKSRQLELILENIIEDGYSQLSIPEFYEYASEISADGNLNRATIARYLQMKGAADSVADAFGRFIGKDCKYFLELGKPTCQEVFQAVREANGIAVIAHLGEYPFNQDQRKEFFEFCIENQVGGYELFHPHNNEEIICAILNEGKKHEELILTLGSDFHGPKVKPNNFVGQTTSKDLSEKVKEIMDEVSSETYQHLCESILKESDLCYNKENQQEENYGKK